MPGANGRPTKTTIDHLVVAASGVWVVDAKSHYGPLDVRRSGGGLTPRVERLFINNRDRTSLVDNLRQQVATVQRILVDAGYTTEVRGALCFIGTTVPWFSEEIAGIALVDEPGLLGMAEATGHVTAEERRALAAFLDETFRPA
jgi:hypothetical protein